MRYIIVLILLGTFSFAACEAGGEEGQPTPTASPAVSLLSPTPQPTPTPTPSPTPVPTPPPPKIVFASHSSSYGEPQGIYVMDVNGSNVERIGDIVAVVSVGVWSHDWSRVAYIKCPDYVTTLDSEIHVRTADGSVDVNVSNNPSHDGGICATESGGGFDLSSDGSSVVFYSYRDPTGLYVVNSDGSGLSFLAEGVNPTWSPDGTAIAFIGDKHEAEWRVDLQVIRPDGTGRRLLARIPCAYSELGGPCMPPRVEWSPDGTMLLFSASPSPPDPGYPPEAVYDVYLLRLDGSGLTNLTDAPTMDHAARWVDCFRPTAGCETQVANVGPEGLNVRLGPTGPGLDASIVGKLMEGDSVCLTGPSWFIDGFQWWPLHAADGAEGWAAAFDPDAVDEPWLTPTGDPCQGEPAG